MLVLVLVLTYFLQRNGHPNGGVPWSNDAER